MRGMRPAGSVTQGSPRACASAPSAPPAVTATTAMRRPSATSTAESTSAVSPEYDSATTSASRPAEAGKP